MFSKEQIFEFVEKGFKKYRHELGPWERSDEFMVKGYVSKCKLCEWTVTVPDSSSPHYWFSDLTCMMSQRSDSRAVGLEKSDYQLKIYVLVQSYGMNDAKKQKPYIIILKFMQENYQLKNIEKLKKYYSSLGNMILLTYYQKMFVWMKFTR